MSKKDAIIEAARGLFGQFGLRKVTTDDIARAAHISKATIYKQYRNKNDIFDDVVSLEAHELIRAIKKAVDEEPSVVGKFKAHLSLRMRKVQELVNLYRVTKESWTDAWPYLAKSQKWFFEEEEKIVKQVMDQGVAEGELEVPRLDLYARITVVALRSLEFPIELTSHNISVSDYTDMMIDMMYNGIRKR